MKRSILFYVWAALMVAIIAIRCGDKNKAGSYTPQPVDTTRTLIVFWEKNQDGTDSAKFLSEAIRYTFDFVDITKEPLVRYRDTVYAVPKVLPIIDTLGNPKKDSLGNPMYQNAPIRVEKKFVTWYLGKDNNDDLDSLLNK